MEAAAALESTDADAAWDCMVNAAFWGRVLLDECPVPVVDATRAMASRQRWRETERVLEDMAARYNASLE